MHIGYLAAPYSHEDPKVKQVRHDIVNQVAHDLIRMGVQVYSPLTHNIPLAHLGLHGNWLTWKAFDHEMLSRCDFLIVLRLEGWQNSLGLKAEMECAKALGKEIQWLDYEEGKLAFSFV